MLFVFDAVTSALFAAELTLRAWCFKYVRGKLLPEARRR